MKNSYKRELDRRRRAQAEAASTPPVQKPVGEMSEAELDAALEQAQAKLRRIKEEELAATRGAAESEAGGRRRFLLPSKRRRPYWK